MEWGSPPHRLEMYTHTFSETYIVDCFFSFSLSHIARRKTWVYNVIIVVVVVVVVARPLVSLYLLIRN